MTTAGTGSAFEQNTVQEQLTLPYTWTPEMLQHEMQVTFFVSAKCKRVERFHRFKNEMLHYPLPADKDSSRKCHQLCHKDIIFCILIPQHWNRETSEADDYSPGN